MHPPDQRDPRFLFPYPAAHSMRLQVVPVLLILNEREVTGHGCGDRQGGMWDHRSTRKPPPPQPQAAAHVREGDERQNKPQVATRDKKFDADALPSAEKRRAEGREVEGGGASSKRWCGAAGRSEDGAGLNGHEASTKEMRQTASEETLAPGGGSQLDGPDSENMEDRYEQAAVGFLWA